MALTVQERNDTAATTLAPGDTATWLAEFYTSSYDTVLQDLANVVRDRIIGLHAHRAANFIPGFMYEGLDSVLEACPQAIGHQMPRRLEFLAEYTDHSQPRPDTLVRPAREHLAKIARLGPDWDSYGAEPVSQTAVIRANTLLHNVGSSFGDFLREQIRPYAVAPLANGGVQLEWRGSGGALEVEVGPEGDLAYLFIEGEGSERTFKEADDVASSDILHLVARVLMS